MYLFIAFCKFLSTMMKIYYRHLHSSINYLLATLRSREKDRSTAFTAVGLLAVAVEDDIKEYIPKIMEVIRGSLPSKVSF